MDNSTIPLITGFIGAIVGSFSAIATVIIQSHFQNKRELTKTATDAAVAHFKISIDYAEKARKKAQVPPLGVYIAYHVELMKLISAGKLSDDAIHKFNERHDEIEKFLMHKE